jgi:hypothetical protein
MWLQHIGIVRIFYFHHITVFYNYFLLCLTDFNICCKEVVCSLPNAKSWLQYLPLFLKVSKYQTWYVLTIDLEYRLLKYKLTSHHSYTLCLLPLLGTRILLDQELFI